MTDYDSLLVKAIKHFWRTRAAQSEKQGTVTGVRDHGARSAVTGGKHMDGFVRLVRQVLLDSGVMESHVHCDAQLELPGYYRAEKKWDLVVVADGTFLAGIEFKAQVGPSFGNNFNNRTEEAIGTASDIWVAYSNGAFRVSQRPWLGYLMLLEDSPGSTKAVGNKEPHFHVFPEFKGASYAKRYEILLTKLVRERLYDSACLLLSQGRFL
jgi:hypothetical protein